MTGRMRRLASGVLVLAGIAMAAPTETAEQRDARMKWWREARFGLFIHWGIYSVPAGIYHGKPVSGLGEWIMNQVKIPVADYAAYAKQFNPVKFNAGDWVRLARDAGAKYIVFTSKHHDGFAMFRSQASPYNVVDATPFGRDVVGEIAEACRKYDVKLGLYYSQSEDWGHPGGVVRQGRWDPAQQGSLDEYLDKVAVPQVREILSNYGPISILWWDLPENLNASQAARFPPLLSLQPGIITNNRLSRGSGGDLSTPENIVPATGIPGKDFEVCMTMNDTWGFKRDDQAWKSGTELIRKLVDTASKGGNYLLNVGPTAEGLIPAPSVDRLEEIGRWLRVNGEAIYGVTAGPFPYLRWGRATRKGQTLYLHVFDWPKDGVLSVPLRNRVREARLLSDSARPLAVESEGGQLVLHLAPQAPDAAASVIALRIEGEPMSLPVPSLGRPGNASSVGDRQSGAERAFDGDHDTHWKAARDQRTAWLEVTLERPVSIGYISLNEGWESEAHIRRFRLDYQDGGQWKTVFEGTRIGRELGRAFPPVTAAVFRLVILEATGTPQIEEMQLLPENQP